MKEKKKKKRQRKGSALIYVLVLFLLATLTIGFLLMLFRWNLSDTIHQQERMKAYYLTRSGLNMGTAALLQQDASGRSLIQDFSVAADPSGTHQLSQVIRYRKVLSGGSSVEYGNTVLRATSQTTGTGSRTERWVVIRAVTSMKDIRPNEDYESPTTRPDLEHRGEVRILVDNPSYQKFDVTAP